MPFCRHRSKREFMSWMWLEQTRSFIIMNGWTPWASFVLAELGFFLRLAVFPQPLSLAACLWTILKIWFVLPNLKYNRYLYEILSIEVHSTVVRRWGSTKPIWVVPAHFYCRPYGFFVPHLLRRRFFFRFGLVIKSMRAFLEGGGTIFFHSFSNCHFGVVCANYWPKFGFFGTNRYRLDFY